MSVRLGETMLAGNTDTTNLATKTEVNARLKLDGTSAMTGELIVKNGPGSIKFSEDISSYLEILGGTNNAKSGSLCLFNTNYSSQFSGCARLGAPNTEGTAVGWLYVRATSLTYAPVGGDESRVITANDIRIDKLTVASGAINPNELITKAVNYTIPANYMPVSISYACDSNEVIMCGIQGNIVGDYIGSLSSSDRTISIYVWFRSFYQYALSDGRNMYIAIQLVRKGL